MEQDELLYLALRQEGCAEYGQKRELDYYKKYKAELLSKDELDEDMLVDMQIFSLLEWLGYPMELLGTYLYKDLIHYVYDKLKDLSGKKEARECKKLISDLENKYSSVYLQVAREGLDMGIKTYHRYVEEAVSKVDKSKQGLEVSYKVLDSELGDMEYGLQAMLLAGMISGKYEIRCKVTEEEVKKILLSECV